MILAKHLIFAGLVTLVTLPMSWAGPDDNSVTLDEESQLITLIRLNHVEALAMANLLNDLHVPVTVAMADDHTILLRGTPDRVQQITKLISTQLDIPGSSVESELTTVFIPLGATQTDTLMRALQAIATSRTARIAIDEVNQMLVVRAQPDEIAGIRAYLKQVVAPVQPEPTRSLALNFFFIRGKIGGGATAASNFPESLLPIIESLDEAGFSNLSLLAPVKLTVDEGLEFSSGSNLSGDNDVEEGYEYLEFRTRGSAHMQPNKDVVQLTIVASISGGFGIAKKNRQDTQFSVATTIATKLGSYAILAAQPTATADGNAIALVVQVTEARSVAEER